MDASFILEKLFSRSSFYDIPCFSILASGPHLDATIKRILSTLRRASIDVMIFNLMDASLVLEDFFSSSRILIII